MSFSRDPRAVSSYSRTARRGGGGGSFVFSGGSYLSGGLLFAAGGGGGANFPAGGSPGIGSGGHPAGPATSAGGFGLPFGAATRPAPPQPPGAGWILSQWRRRDVLLFRGWTIGRLWRRLEGAGYDGGGGGGGAPGGSGQCGYSPYIDKRQRGKMRSSSGQIGRNLLQWLQAPPRPSKQECETEPGFCHAPSRAFDKEDYHTRATLHRVKPPTRGCDGVEHQLTDHTRAVPKLSTWAMMPPNVDRLKALRGPGESYSDASFCSWRRGAVSRHVRRSACAAAG